MDNKTKAEGLRKIADLSDEIAKHKDAIDMPRSAGYSRADANEYREQANELDPPTVSYESGDLVLDRDGDLWTYGSADGGYWYRFNSTQRLSLYDLTRMYGPHRKVHLADPAKQEVVISLDGITSDGWVNVWADETEDSHRHHADSTKAVIRAAKAARDQLGQVK